MDVGGREMSDHYLYGEGDSSEGFRGSRISNE